MKRREAIRNISIGMGCSLSIGGLMSLAQSCKGESNVEYWVPDYLTSDQAYIMEEIADIYLPSTETPGAKDVGVAEFMDVVIGNVYDAQEKDKFQKAYNAFISRASNKKDGKDLNREKLEAHISEVYENMSQEEWDNIRNMINAEDPPSDPQKQDDYYYYNFLIGMKSLSMAGYFRSELIGEEYLSYDPIPGVYLGCIPLSDVGNAWSL